MAFWVYLLKCSDGSYYTGHTDDIDRRFGEHQAGLGGDYTKRRRPVTLAFAEWFQTRDDAFARERQFKNWSRAKKDALCRQDWQRLHELAVPPSERHARASLDVARD